MHTLQKISILSLFYISHTMALTCQITKNFYNGGSCCSDESGYSTFPSAFTTVNDLLEAPMISYTKTSGYPGLEDVPREYFEFKSSYYQQYTAASGKQVGDQGKIQVFVYKPKNFDPSKQYPLFIGDESGLTINVFVNAFNQPGFWDSFAGTPFENGVITIAISGEANCRTVGDTYAYLAKQDRYWLTTADLAASSCSEKWSFGQTKHDLNRDMWLQEILPGIKARFPNALIDRDHIVRYGVSYLGQGVTGLMLEYPEIARYFIAHSGVNVGILPPTVPERFPGFSDLGKMFGMNADGTANATFPYQQDAADPVWGTWVQQQVAAMKSKNLPVSIAMTTAYDGITPERLATGAETERLCLTTTTFLGDKLVENGFSEINAIDWEAGVQTTDLKTDSAYRLIRSRMTKDYRGHVVQLWADQLHENLAKIVGVSHNHVANRIAPYANEDPASVTVNAYVEQIRTSYKVMYSWNSAANVKYWQSRVESSNGTIAEKLNDHSVHAIAAPFTNGRFLSIPGMQDNMKVVIDAYGENGKVATYEKAVSPNIVTGTEYSWSVVGAAYWYVYRVFFESSLEPTDVGTSASVLTPADISFISSILMPIDQFLGLGMIEITWPAQSRRLSTIAVNDAIINELKLKMERHKHSIH